MDGWFPLPRFSLTHVLHYNILAGLIPLHPCPNEKTLEWKIFLFFPLGEPRNLGLAQLVKLQDWHAVCRPVAHTPCGMRVGVPRATTMRNRKFVRRMSWDLDALGGDI